MKNSIKFSIKGNNIIVLTYIFCVSTYIATNCLVLFGIQAAQTSGGRLISFFSLALATLLLFYKGKENGIIKIDFNSPLFYLIFFWAYTILIDFSRGISPKVNVIAFFLCSTIYMCDFCVGDLRKIIKVIILSYLMICVVSLFIGSMGYGFDNLYVDNKYLKEIRFRGIMQHSNGLAPIASIPLLYYLNKKSENQILKYVSIIIVIYTLFLTKSKTSIYSIIIYFP